jgi:hypothetical protein
MLGLLRRLGLADPCGAGHSWRRVPSSWDGQRATLRRCARCGVQQSLLHPSMQPCEVGFCVLLDGVCIHCGFEGEGE